MSEDFSEFPHGYRADLEDVSHIEATQRQDDAADLFKASMDRPIDEKVREAVKEKVHVEGQARTSSCCGHTGSSLAEFNLGLETGDWDTQLSRWGCYILAQEESGIKGDNGAYIDAMCRSGSKKGYGLESLWKFTGTYHTRPAGGKPAMDAFLADASKRKLNSWKLLHSYAEMAVWSQTGQGGIAMGIPWYTNWYNGVKGVMPSPNGQQSGLHAYPLFWQTKRMEGSRPYFEGPNSWLKTWSVGGWAEWSPSLIDWLHKRRGAVFVGMSDLTHEDKRARRVDYRKQSAFLGQG